MLEVVFLDTTAPMSDLEGLPGFFEHSLFEYTRREPVITKVSAQFRTKHGDVFYGTVTMDNDQMPATAKLEQYYGTFTFDHMGEMPVYVEKRDE